MKRATLVALVAALLAGACSRAPTFRTAARLVPLGGPVQVARGGSWGTLVRPEDLAAGDMIRSEAGRAMLGLADGGRLELAPHTTLRRPA